MSREPKWVRLSVGCKHENVTDYHDGGSCDTPYCEWNEYHCRDCGAFFSECGCGYNNGMSGEPHRKVRNRECARIAAIIKARQEAKP